VFAGAVVESGQILAEIVSRARASIKPTFVAGESVVRASGGNDVNIGTSRGVSCDDVKVSKLQVCAQGKLRK